MAKTDSNQPVTRGMLDEAVQAILEGMDGLVKDLRSEMNTDFENLDAKIDQTRNEVKDEIDG